MDDLYITIRGRRAAEFASLLQDDPTDTEFEIDGARFLVRGGDLGIDRGEEFPHLNLTLAQLAPLQRATQWGKA